MPRKTNKATNTHAKKKKKSIPSGSLKQASVYGTVCVFKEMLEKYVSHKLASSVFNVIQKMGSVSVAKALLIRVAMGTEEVAPHFEWQPGWNQELLWRGFLLTPYITMGISELIKKKKHFFFKACFFKDSQG